jgi:hypothetical protein
MSDLLAPIMNQYSNFAMTGDGIPEINSLTYLPFESGYPDPLPAQRVVLVLVEPRLLAATGNAAFRTDLTQCLQRFKGDLRAEGLFSRFIAANIYGGAVQKDGRIVLALRRFFRDVKAAFINFEGVILVGNFPEASLVRRVSWSPGFLNPRQLAIAPELISERAEVVLADFTGNWESIYQQNDFNAEVISATPDAATTAAGWFDGESVRTCTFTSTNFTVSRSGNFRDAFFMDDAIYTVVDNQSTPTPFLRVRLNQAERNNEVDINDRSMVNIIARPDINVSRINALHVGVNPNPALVGTDGHRFLDAAGNPQVVSNPTPLFNEPQHLNLFNFRDIDLERRLLVSYFKRNHKFRNGAFSNLPFRTAVIAGTDQFSPDWYEPIVNAAATDFQPCVKTPNATLPQYVQFHKTPATFKYIIAHSNSTYSEFRDGGNVNALTTEVGGVPLRWVYQSGQYTPGFDGQGGNADIYTHRALWHYNTLQGSGASLMIHGGCNVNSVSESQHDTYTSPNYARWNNAEGILFYTNCVALFSRAKGFNDAPNGFADGYRLSDRANFGSCWKSYFNSMANDGSLSVYNIQRKRAYFWSINGDWSLRLRNRNGLGIISLDGSLRSAEVHPDRAWIDGWNYESAINRIRGIGDIDGDGTDEMVLTSDWGIGILKYNGSNFRALLTAPRDTWFGGWRYDASVNTGRDRIMAVRNFTGSSNAEIMIWSSWGMTTLEYNGASLFPSRIFANGSRLGGWLFNSADNVYCGSGQFDNDPRIDIVLMSPWGLGIISMQNSSHVFMAPNGTRFGGWLFGSHDNQIRLIADLDGDGLDEILISSPWGIGVLKMQGGALTSLALYANGSNLGGYIVNNSDNFALADTLRGGVQKQLLVTNASGVHLLSLSGSALVRTAFAGSGTRIDGWMIDTSNNSILPAGDINGDGSGEFVVRSPWGIGVMGVDAANHFRCYSMFPYNSMLNDWYLQSSDVIVGSGNLSGGADRKELLFVKS